MAAVNLGRRVSELDVDEPAYHTVSCGPVPRPIWDHNREVVVAVCVAVSHVGLCLKGQSERVIPICVGPEIVGFVACAARYSSIHDSWLYAQHGYVANLVDHLVVDCFIQNSTWRGDA